MYSINISRVSFDNRPIALSYQSMTILGTSHVARPVMSFLTHIVACTSWASSNVTTHLVKLKMQGRNF